MGKKNRNQRRKYTGGGDVIELPRGHRAVFWSSGEIPIWKDRELEVVSLQINRQKLKALSQAAEVEIDGAIVTDDDILAGERQTLSEHESRLLFRMTDTCIWAYLKSWTLRDATGNPIPLPESADQVAKLVPDKATFEALGKAANERWLETEKDEFTPDGGLDEETGRPIEGTPTVASNS